MDFTKFVSMLENKGLYFPRIDQLGDPFEGSFSRANEPLLRQQYSEAVEHDKKTFLRDLIEVQPQIRRHVKNYRKWVFVNCWHISDRESAAMWKLYTKSNEAVSIQSTYEKLRASLPTDSVYVGTVRYIDYENEFLPPTNIFQPFMHKRKSFEHERELRALFTVPSTDIPAAQQGEEPPYKGAWKKIHLPDLVEGVFIAPSAPTWLADLTSRILDRYDLRISVMQSSLDAPPSSTTLICVCAMSSGRIKRLDSCLEK